MLNALLWSHLLAGAGATDASKQSIDHLEGTEDELHDGGHEQSGEQPQVEFNHILWKFTPLPKFPIVQVAAATVNGWEWVM